MALQRQQADIQARLTALDPDGTAQRSGPDPWLPLGGSVVAVALAGLVLRRRFRSRDE